MGILESKFKSNPCRLAETQIFCRVLRAQAPYICINWKNRKNPFRTSCSVCTNFTLQVTMKVRIIKLTNYLFIY